MGGISCPAYRPDTFASDKFREYWFETGTPTFLVTLLKQTDYDIRRIVDNDVEIDADMFSGANDYINDPIPVLYQSGYPESGSVSQ